VRATFWTSGASRSPCGVSNSCLDAVPELPLVHTRETWMRYANKILKPHLSSARFQAGGVSAQNLGCHPSHAHICPLAHWHTRPFAQCLLPTPTGLTPSSYRRLSSAPVVWCGVGPQNIFQPVLEHAGGTRGRPAACAYRTGHHQPCLLQSYNQLSKSTTLHIHTVDLGSGCATVRQSLTAWLVYIESAFTAAGAGTPAFRADATSRRRRRPAPRPGDGA
jgi:hypothetical protein